MKIIQIGEGEQHYPEKGDPEYDAIPEGDRAAYNKATKARLAEAEKEGLKITTRRVGKLEK